MLFETFETSNHKRNFMLIESRFIFHANTLFNYEMPNGHLDKTREWEIKYSNVKNYVARVSPSW